MGRLHRLELENFKSYNGVQVVGPFENFSAIVGPNGSGKSNMMDAISFVLGVQSRHLRSSHLKELIFRQDANSPPARRASVKLVYIVSGGEVEGFAAGTEIHFSRTISSTGVSSYRLDNKEVTYEAYENLLQCIGVLVKARNFLVFQGDVESVASKSPLELTKLLEQISGSDQLRDEYEELLRKKDEAEENTIFSMQKKKMYVTQRKEVKEQKDEAELFQERQEELSNLKTEHVLWQIWRIKMGMETHQQAAEGFRKELESVKTQENGIDELMQNGKQELAKLSKLVSAAEKDHSAKSKHLDGIAPKLSETRAKLTSLKKRISDLTKSEAKLEKDRSEQQTNIEGLRADMAALEAAEEELKAELEESGASASSLQMDQEKAKEYARLREELSARTASQRTEELSIQQEMTSKQLRVERLESQEEALKVELESTQTQIGEYTERGNALKKAIADGENEKTSLRNARDAATKEMRDSQQKVDEMTAELEEVSMQLRDVGDDRRRSKQEERMNEAIENMQRIFTGVHGKLIDLCRPIQKKYATAIATAAGKHMDAIVVESKHVAAECIRYLRDQRVGTCMFLPLDNISSKPPPERMRALGGRYRLCIDLVESDDMYKPALSYALGVTLVCDTLEDAQDLCFGRGEKVKVVTLKGHVIGKTGAMTGGFVVREGGDRWEEKEVERLRKRKGELESEIAKVKQSAPTRQHIVDLETKLKTLQTRAQYSEADLKVSQEKLAQLQQQKSLKEKASGDLRKEADGLRKEITALERRLGRLTQQTREVEMEVFGAFSAGVGVANIREYEENKLRHHQELVKKSSAVSEQRASLSAQLEYELKRDFAGALKRFQSQIADAQKQATTLEKEEQTLLTKEEQLIVAVRAALEHVKTVSDERTAVATKVKGFQTQRSSLSSEKVSLEKKLSGEEILIERQRGQLHEVLQRAQVDEVALPAVEVASSSSSTHRSSIGDSSSGRSTAAEDDDLLWVGSQTSHGSSSGGGGRRDSRSRGASASASDTDDNGSGTTQLVSTSAHFSQANNAVVLKDQKKAAKVDLSSMEKHRNMTTKQMNDAEAALANKISALVSELETMQPNMHAAERYEGVVEKLRECEKDLDTAKDTATTITTRFEDVRKKRQQLFNECYQHISDALGVIYKDLTRSSKHPLGGNAYLTLDNTDEPYTAGIRFTAMPPMKRFRDMDQLSGGEKTMAALALLFSIHSYRQAPFFVLDEVDAALDNVNVKKICNYIRQRSRDFQCIVISLKDMFFEHADILVGICKDVTSLSSKVLTLNLRDYDAPHHRSAAAAPTGRPVLRSPMTDTRSASTPSTGMSTSTLGSARSFSGDGAGNVRGGSGVGSGSGSGSRAQGGRGGTKLKRKVGDIGGADKTSRRIRPSLPESIAEEGEDDLEEEEEEGGDEREDEDEHK